MLELQQLREGDTERLGQFLQSVDLGIEPRALSFEALDALVVKIGEFSQFLLSKAMLGPQFADSMGESPANILCHTPQYGKPAAQLTPHRCPIYTVFIDRVRRAIPLRECYGRISRKAVCLNDWGYFVDRPACIGDPRAMAISILSSSPHSCPINCFISCAPRSEEARQHLVLAVLRYRHSIQSIHSNLSESERLASYRSRRPRFIRSCNQSIGCQTLENLLKEIGPSLGMIKKAKEFLGGLGIVVGGIAIMGTLMAIPILLINWYEIHFDAIYPWLVKVNAVSFGLILLSLLISLFPRARGITGSTIVLCSWALGAALWLLNLFISLNTLGHFWTIVGMLGLGIGVFVTAGIGLLLKGQFPTLLLILLYLAIIYGVRFLGVFIASNVIEM